MLLNLSSGVARFKRLRGGRPAMEYTAIYCRHLPRRRRIAWQTLALLLERVGGAGAGEEATVNRSCLNPFTSDRSKTMKVSWHIQTLRLVVIGLALVWSLPAVAADDPAPETQGENAADHDALRELRDKLIQAINDKDTEGLLALLEPDVVLTTQDGEQLKAIRGHDGVRDYMTRMLTGPNHLIGSLQVRPTVDDLTILYHGDTGVAFGSSQDHYQLVDGTQFDLATRWSATMVKENGGWLIANLQTSSNLFDNSVLAAVWHEAEIFSALTGIGGLALGVVLGRRLFRRVA